MKKLILHIGSGKCGSSSIQDFCQQDKQVFVEDVVFKLLDPTLIIGLNSKEVDREQEELLKRYIPQNDILILSHEFLFQNPYAVKNICNIFKEVTDDIRVVGYSRRQSDFLISAYSQWWFRAKERTDEVESVLKDFGIESRVFSGVEKQLIASIINDFYSARMLSEYNILNWNQGYRNIEQLMDAQTAVFHVGFLPNRDYKFDLIEDFCQKSSITMLDEGKVINKEITNQSFNSYLIEAINCATYIDGSIVGPHDKNEVLHKISKKIETKIEFSNFILDMKSYVDNYFYEENIDFSQRHQLESDYFKPSYNIDKKRVIEKIKIEEKSRLDNIFDTISRYQELSSVLAKACIHLGASS